MSSKVTHRLGRCRHEKDGFCTNHFWVVMKAKGKPGLIDYACVLWRGKIEAVFAYQEAMLRTARFELTEGRRRGLVLKAMNRRNVRAPECPDFRPRGGNPGDQEAQCRYLFLECCLKKFPSCQGPCDDFLPEGDRR